MFYSAIIPIFNSMSRIDRRLLEASYDNAPSLTAVSGSRH